MSARGQAVFRAGAQAGGSRAGRGAGGRALVTVGGRQTALGRGGAGAPDAGRRTRGLGRRWQAWRAPRRGLCGGGERWGGAGGAGRLAKEWAARSEAAGHKLESLAQQVPRMRNAAPQGCRGLPRGMLVTSAAYIHHDRGGDSGRRTHKPPGFRLAALCGLLPPLCSACCTMRVCTAIGMAPTRVATSYRPPPLAAAAAARRSCPCSPALAPQPRARCSTCPR